MEGRPEDEFDLIARARGGEQAACEEIVRRFQDVAFRTAYVITRSAEDAEDAAQEGFAKAFGALSRFRSDASLRPWLLTIVANEARTRTRSGGRRRRLELRLAEDFRPGDAAPSPEAVAVQADERRRLLALVNGLGDDDRDVIACRYFLQLSVDETAAALGVPEGTVKSRLSRALARLKSRVEEAANA
jgi:RNA polymerase sigma-70 factor (ECF subfamily)